ncbi:tRNA (adenosine(37)-N6)-dimethylallyltransferase MiaA [Achromobacter xylosoxidans]|uniref:tRNA (adenosine(37)-N6)-dimethylallyltransferase MiaA n=1 Tax=Alcaligenes xylosoxydans xylosoxydans TaxID=85698 RepID=UPI0003D5C11F|nr:tRNA (adenosine(37)-N6)-dimethylallyltransferase MiaA [Achromobacter xylosoxidans]AHC45391.1 tRNA delta(2)-isopentenylpyrophosphate transferase [Achromobacter xylosoxidans NBRC 15126 = ATCC 27061]QKQ55670.1 tRNA (adenosine(37)-N6)-dimethylallyltransferase MiaA [Achromobacter xylosoxidans]QPR95173.1 tRNA (adenosine(37)-N6)-dimethylallyltransferase MiaA [Achromobacter xylosoxidans]UON39117.1 tRNA (adenosine(37)-N6)-dimethylallyltransferase MiaA [Achromobacter xylosoxidans]
MPVSTPPLVICLAGPTAAGKSASTLALAERWPLEIVNVDSATIYRGMDIGTAKPSPAEQAQVPQHLLDIRDPAQSYSAAEFRADALRLIDEIRARGRIPLLAGGTMMYYKALRDGLDDLPQADPALRAELEARAARDGWPALHAELARLDPVTAARLAPNDSQRIQRALEICQLSGQPMSALLGRQRAAAGDDDNRYLTISLEPSERAALHARIEQRFDAMLANGLLEEVRGLHARADLHPGLPSVRCVGYRQMWAHLDGEISLEEAREQGIAATRQLAKRQITWLRAQPERVIVDCLAADAVAQTIDAVAAALADAS